MTTLFSKTIDFDQPFQRLRLHSFWTISTENQWEISEVGRLSCFIEFFVWFHIVCDRYTSDYDQITFFTINVQRHHIFTIGHWTLGDLEKIAFFQFSTFFSQKKRWNGCSKSIVLENNVAINFDFSSGAKKSGHLDYPLQSYGPKFVNMPKYA